MPQRFTPEFKEDDWQAKTAAAKNIGELLNLYEREWRNGSSPPLNLRDLTRLMGRTVGDHGPYNHDDLPDIARELAHARKSISPFRNEIAGASDFQLLFALNWSDRMVALWSGVLKSLSAGQRVSGAEALVEEFVRLYGHEKTRDQIALLWQQKDLLEEERETVLAMAIRHGVYDWQTLLTLAPDAQALAEKLLARGRVHARELGLLKPLEAPPIHGTRSSPEWLKESVSSLGQRVLIPLHLAGSGLSPTELARLDLTGLHPLIALAAIDEYRRLFRHPFIEEMLHTWEREWPIPLHGGLAGAGSGVSTRLLSIPLIRLLHMRRLLDSPSLASALANPAEALVPEVFLHLLQYEGVVYNPEIRLPGGAGRGWRRRWAESSGEAFSCLFLEDTLALDLTTLIRIPEAQEETPDFLAKTFSGEFVVFESKGSTAWETFRRSKRKALKQLAKTGSTAKWKRSIGWGAPAKGRSFACCLFVATVGAVEQSQFHVEDPPFAFERLFHEGWEDAARRRHYAAVLEAAGLYSDAAGLLGLPHPDIAHGSEIYRLSLSEEVGEEFTGAYFQPADAARILGHPEPGAFRDVRVFAGIESGVLSQLRDGRLPAGRPFGLRHEGRPEKSPIPPFGILPGEEPGGPARGLYSRMSDGSFLAVEMV
jgi:hypothetical protein